MVRAVISDLGKVVLDFDNRLFFRRIAEYSSHSEEDIARLAFAGRDLIELFDTGRITAREFFLKVKEALKAEIDYQAFAAIYSDVFSPIPHVLDVYKRLKPRCRLILLSNTDALRFDFVRRKFPQILIFDDYVLSFEVGVMKPHTEIYRLVLKAAGVEAGECVFIDDIKENIEAAVGLGIHGIHFDFRRTDLERELQRLGLDF